MAMSSMLESYYRDHQHPVNKAFHMVGIPIILMSIPLVFFSPAVGISLFVFGWILQFIGHAFEGKMPSFFRDPRFLFVGASWYVRRAVAKVTGQPLPGNVIVSA